MAAAVQRTPRGRAGRASCPNRCNKSPQTCTLNSHTSALHALWHFREQETLLHRLTSSVPVTKVRETPHVPQAHAVSDAGEQELILPPPLLPLDGWGWTGCRTCKLWLRHRCFRRVVAIFSHSMSVKLWCTLRGQKKKRSDNIQISISIIFCCFFSKTNGASKQVVT